MNPEILEVSEARQRLLAQIFPLEIEVLPLSQVGMRVLGRDFFTEFGAPDYVRSVIEKKGKLSFWQVNMHPDNPLVLGKIQDVPVIS